MIGPAALLYLSCWSLKEPQGERLVTAPLRILTRQGLRVHLITFEQPRYRGSEEERRSWREALEREGITWHPIAYHHKPLAIAKPLDAGSAWMQARRILAKERIRLIHARSTIPMVVTALLGQGSQIPVVYESDASIAQERLDVGIWRRGTIYRLTRLLERWLPGRCAEMIVLSSRHAERLKTSGVERPITVIPCCTDLDPFRRNHEARRTLRARLGWGDSLVLVYSGSLGSWYQFSEMAQFFKHLLDAFPQARWLCLANDPDRAAEEIAGAGIPPHAFSVRRVPAEEVPQWLSAADVAMSFIRAGISKFASSPTKSAEYLACGLPTLMTPGIGDTEQIAEDPRGGFVLRSFDEAGHEAAIRWLRRLALDLDSAADYCRKLAQERFSIQEVAAPAYRRIYERLAPDLFEASSEKLVLPNEHEIHA